MVANMIIFFYHRYCNGWLDYNFHYVPQLRGKPAFSKMILHSFRIGWFHSMHDVIVWRWGVVYSSYSILCSPPGISQRDLLHWDDCWPKSPSHAQEILSNRMYFYSYMLDETMYIHLRLNSLTWKQYYFFNFTFLHLLYFHIFMKKSTLVFLFLFFLCNLSSIFHNFF